MNIEWARQHEHDPDPVVRNLARQILRDHYLPQLDEALR